MNIRKTTTNGTADKRASNNAPSRIRDVATIVTILPYSIPHQFANKVAVGSCRAIMHRSVHGMQYYQQ